MQPQEPRTCALLNTELYKRRFLIRINERLIPIGVEDIAYFFVDNNITFVKTWDDKRFIVEHSLTELQALLDPALFFRINRAHLIQFKALAGITVHHSNRLKLALVPPFREEVFVSRDKVPQFKRWIGG